MDWNTIINYALKVLVMVICGLITAYVIPWLNAKRTEIKQKAKAEGWYAVLDAIDKFVAAAEQMAINEGYSDEWKKQYVVNLVETTCGIEVDAELDAYIESAVILLHNALYGNVE